MLNGTFLDFIISNNRKLIGVSLESIIYSNNKIVHIDF